MSISYTFRGDVLWFEIGGDSDFDEALRDLRSAFAEMVEACLIEPLQRWHIVFDAHDFVETRTAEQIQKATMILAAHKRYLSGRCAVVVAQHVQYALARMFAMFTESFGIDVETFSGEQDALEWLHTAVRS